MTWLRRGQIGVLTALSFVFLIAGPAVATPTYSPIINNAGEPNVAAILNDITGSSWTLPQLNSGSGGRVDDDWDQIWQDGITTVTFTGIWWGNAFQTTNPIHKFGYTLDGGSQVELLSTQTSNPNDSTTAFIGVGDIRWYANRGSSTAWSDPSLNSALSNGSFDRMVTFNVSNASLNLYDSSGTANQSYTTGADAYLLFFDTGSDSDMQDFVALAEGVAPVPEPTTLLLLGSGLIGLAGFRRKFRKG